MRILCDQMVKESYVETLASQPEHTVTRIRDELRPDATDQEIAASATVNAWVVLSANDDFFDEMVPHGLLYYDDRNAPSPRVLRVAIRAIETAYDESATIIEWIPDGWV